MSEPDPAWASIATGMWAVLGLLSLRTWTGYEIAQQAPRSINRAWPQRDSSLYAHPPKLVDHGLASVTTEKHGGRTRKRYAITDRGREALSWWLAQPTSDPEMFIEPFVRMMFADQGSPESTIRTIEGFSTWAAENCEAMLTQLEGQLGGGEPFPHRSRQNSVTALGHAMMYSAILEWTQRARELHMADPTLAHVDANEIRREAISLHRAALEGFGRS